ncbi:MAG: YggS family pyridoxal phosphate-dependent enzyme [Chloroflexi bacterium]|nr:YggS family pyridoxal phosphate-dependent enzyme [Chloroflexota bacterium]
MGSLAERYERVCERIATAARQAGRDPDGVRLVAVSKGRPADAAHALYALGQRDFGENRAEEGSDKIAALAADAGLVWHMIGHVQSRKARAVAAQFHWVHSVDNAELAGRLSRAAATDRPLPILLECNVSGEPAKYGWAADRTDDDPAQWEALRAGVEGALALPGVAVRGLMTMAPVVADAEQARPVFAKLRRLRDRLAARFPAAGWAELSMGMTDDFEVAIAEGATMVRVGRAIFAPPQ